MTTGRGAAGTDRLSVTVVMASRDRPQLVREALEAARTALRPGDSMILVDSASADPEAIASIAREAGVTLIRCEEPGASRARNLGWRAASTELVAFTDDDCLPDSRWLEAAAEAFEGKPSVGFVTGPVVSASKDNRRAWLHLSLTSRTVPATFGPEDDPTEIGHGANMIWRRSALEQIGGFDEMLGPGAPLRAAEDVDVFWRLLLNGGTGMFDPDAVVAHRQWRGRVKQLRVYVGYGVGSGALAVKRWRFQGGNDVRLSRREAAKRGGRELVWAHGVEGMIRNVEKRFAMGALAELAMAAGAVKGVTRARRMDLVDGHFVRRV